MPSKREQLLEIMEDAAKGETKATLRARIAELEAENRMKMSDLAKENEMLRRALEDIAAPAMFFLSRRDAIKMRDTARATLRARQALYEGDGG